MIREERRRAITRQMRKVKMAQTVLDNAQEDLVVELKGAHIDDKSSYGELGKVLGLSRQRVHQLVSQ